MQVYDDTAQLTDSTSLPIRLNHCSNLKRLYITYSIKNQVKYELF